MANILNIGLSAVATGTVDVITATFSPAITLTDRRIVFLRTLGANSITTPTFNPNGLGAQTITKHNGQALSVADLDGVVCLMYDLANTNWELITVNAGIESVLNNGDRVNEQSILSNNGLNYLALLNASNTLAFDDGVTALHEVTMSATLAQLYYSTAVAIGLIKFTDVEALLQHDLKVRLNAPNINLAQETASLILSTDASKNIKGLSTVTYPSLTELAFVKGVTSAIQTQLNAIVSITDGDKGDIVVISAGTVWVIDTNAVTNAKAAQMPTMTIKGNDTAATANAIDLTEERVFAMLLDLTSGYNYMQQRIGLGN